MTTIDWGDDALALRILRDNDGRTRLVRIVPGAAPTPFERALPLVEIVTTSRSRRSGSRYDRTDAGMDLRYEAHRAFDENGLAVLEVDLRDPRSALRVTQRYTRRPGLAALSSSALVTNGGTGVTRRTTSVTATQDAQSESIRLLFVSSFALGDARFQASDTNIHLADNEWLAEARWYHGTFDELGGPDTAMQAHGGASPRGALARLGRGTWSTGEHLPMGAFERADGTLLWQVESNGGWRFQVARSLGLEPTGVLDLVTSGPTDPEHQWSQILAAGETFTTPVTTIAWSPGTFDNALAVLTQHRRLDHRVFAGDTGLPVIYNDYMNTINADPTTGKLLPLIQAVGRTGAEIFVVDAGWYSEEAGWWDTVGAWEASPSRFPGGFTEVFDAIRAEGMTPGLWLEPEAVGIRSPMAQALPPEAFFRRNGERVVVDGRYRMDFRHPAAVAHLDAVLDRVISDYGLGYVKFDDNVNAVSGTDEDASSSGSGLLLAGRAFLDWIDRLHERHPRLIIENCSSGGMSADWQTLSHFALLSTSDQQEPLRCVPIAAASPTIAPPELAGVWSYPQTGMSRGETTVTLANSVLRRPILSGRLDLMDEAELSVVRAFVDAHKALRAELPTLFPTWPLGLPAWEDDWIVAGLTNSPDGATAMDEDADAGAATHAYLTVWRRGGSEGSVIIPLGSFGVVTGIETVFPSDTEADWALDDDVLRITLGAPSAVVLRLHRAD